MSGLHIRPALGDDLPALQRLLGSIDDEPPMPADAAEACFRRLEAVAGCTLWLACDDDQPVGTYSLYILETLGHGGAHFAVVESVAVDPQRRGQGIGKRMMEHAREQAAAAGCYKLMLSSHLKREAAHRFYDGLGFERHGYSFVVKTG